MPLFYVDPQSGHPGYYIKGTRVDVQALVETHPSLDVVTHPSLNSTRHPLWFYEVSRPIQEGPAQTARDNPGVPIPLSSAMGPGGPRARGPATQRPGRKPRRR